MSLIKTFLITSLLVLFLACGVAESVAFEPAVLVPPTAQAASQALSDYGDLRKVVLNLSLIYPF